MKRIAVDTKEQAVAGVSQGPSWYLSAGYLYFSIPISGSASSIILRSTSQIVNTDWHHIATFRAGNKIFLYIDGVFADSEDVTGMSFDPSQYSFDIGGRL
jgi:hypothetical protein